jgi:hypothetical protein
MRVLESGTVFDEATKRRLPWKSTPDNFSIERGTLPPPVRPGIAVDKSAAV